MTRADILLTINSNLEGIRKANEAILGTRNNARSLNNEFQSFGRTLASSLGIGAGFSIGAKAADMLTGALRGVAGAVKDTIREGVAFNATLETAQLSVGAVLKQFNPEKYRTFGDATKEAANLVGQLKQRALETSATFEELLTGFQSTAGVMATAGVPLRKQIDLLVTTSQAMSALGINAHELRQELTALLMGNIDRNARLAKTLEPLGVNNESIARAKEAGTLYEFLTEKMSEFAEAGRLASGNLEVLQSNLQDARTQSAAEATEGLAFAYKGLLRELTTFTTSDAYKKTMEFLSNIVALGTFKLSTFFGGFGFGSGSTSSTATGSSEADAAEGRAAVARAEAERLAKESADARAKGVKEYEQMQERNRAAIRAAAKASDPALYLQLLQSDKSALEQKLLDPRANREFYLTGIADPTAAQQEEARKAASAYRLEISAKIADVERQIADTTESQARKAKAEADARTRAEVRFLQVKAEGGTLDEKITALQEEKAALDKTSVTYKADELAIEMRIAKLKDDEAARLRSEQMKAAQRAQDAAINAIRDDQFITARTKQQLLYNAFKQEEAAIEEKIAAARSYAASLSLNSPLRPQADRELEDLLNRRDVGLPQDIETNSPLTMMEEMKAGLVSLVDSFATVGTMISDVIGGALQSVTANLTGLIMQTQTWGQALRNIGVAILTSVVGAIVQASVQWVARKIIEFALGNTLRAAALAANLGTAIALSEIWATPATLATIATFGGAAMAAPAEIAGAMGAVHGMALFAKGGYTGPGGVNDPAGIVHKGEIVFSQRDIQRLGGVAAVEAMRVSGGGFGGGSAVTAVAGSAPVKSNGGGGQTVNQAFFNTQQDAEQWLMSQPGRRVMTDFIRQQSYEL